MELLADLDHFLHRFAELDREIEQNRQATDLDSLRSLLDKAALVIERAEETIRKEAPFFSIFEILNIHFGETKTHTPFLAHLLSPSGTHAQGVYFFHSFLKDVVKISYNATDITNIQVYEEFHCGENGRIDILIFYKLQGQQRAIAIENKIYSGDMEDQLQRYYDFLIRVRKFTQDQVHLIYLKPLSTVPDIYTISPKTYREMSDKKRFLNLGYHEHILPWLRSVNKYLPPVVQATIHQYTHTLEKL